MWGIATAPQDIFHITTEADWAHAQAEGVYSLSTRGLTLAQVGFVHCAFEKQVSGVANSVFGGVAELVVLRIAIDRLKVEVRYEDLLGGHELFPHIYGPLNLDAVVATTPVQPACSSRKARVTAANSGEPKML